MPTPEATPAAGTPVPAYPTCRVPGCVSFTPGVRNGEPYGPDTIAELVDNYRRFKEPQPDKGWAGWLPFASVDHEEHPDWAGLSVGDVADAVAEDADGNPALTLDLDRVPVPIGALINGGQLRARSVEWFEPPNAFVGPDGPVDGKVLKSVSFLGNKSEAAKGMPRPTAVFADAYRPAPTPPNNPSTPALKFESAPAMDRAAMIQALSDAGFDTSAITDAVPGAVVQEAYEWVVGDGTQDPPADPAARFESQPVSRDDMLAALAAAGVDTTALADPAAVPDAAVKAVYDAVMAAKGAAAPTQMKQGGPLKFADRRAHRLFDGFTRDLAELKARDKRRQQDHDRRLAADKAGKVKRFLDEVQGGKEPKIVQAQRPALEAMLLGCDDSTVRKFADGKTDGTALDEQMALVRGWPAARTFGDKLADPIRGGAGPGGEVRPEVVARMLKATPEGRAAAARRAKAAA